MARKKRALSTWVNASANSTFRQYDLGYTTEAMSSFMQRLHDTEVERLQREGNLDPEHAIRQVEKTLVRRDLAKDGKPVWQVRRSQIKSLVNSLQKKIAGSIRLTTPSWPTRMVSPAANRKSIN